MRSIVDRYKNRPDTDEMKCISLAEFCSAYRVLAASQNQPGFIQLKNNFGFVLKRTRSEPAVIRYPKFSVTKDPSKYYHSILQLFLPNNDNCQLKPPPFETYEALYENGAVRIANNTLQTVKCIVDTNCSY